MFERIKTFLVGNALKDTDLSTEKFSVKWGLPIYSSDAISSVAYAGEEMLIVLVPALFMGAYKYYILCIAAILFLLVILAISYSQTIDAYPNGGGAYGVATENLGKIPGLIAGAALIIGYILTVAASSAAATAAIYSAFPVLQPYRVFIALGIIALLTWGNLRGMRESAVMFGTPTYMFIAIIVITILVGAVKAVVHPEMVPKAASFNYQPTMLEGATLFLVLRAFGAGCTALTGVEAVSNAVPNFRDPATKNAKKVLALLAMVCLVCFLGLSILTAVYHVTPDPSGGITVIAQLAERVYGEGSIGFYIVQVATVIILALAANTAFAGMPVLLALMAKDGYMPRKMTNRGIRLGFSNGIEMVFLASALLIIIFRADTHSLLPLYATGVFLAFTLSQTGMLIRWIRKKNSGWKHRAVINGIGAAMSATTCLIIAISRFTAGAWMVLVAIPVIVLVMEYIHRHYHGVQNDLLIDLGDERLSDVYVPKVKIVMPISNLNRAFLKSLHYAMSIQGDLPIELYHVASSEEDQERYRERVEEMKELMNLNAVLVIEETPYRNYSEMLLRHVDMCLEQLDPHETLTVVMSQIIIRHWWQRILHNQTSEQLKRQLEHKRNVSVVSVPYLLK